MTVYNDFVFSRVAKPPHSFRIRGMSARCEFRRLSDGDPVPCWIMTFDCTPEAPDSDLPYRGQIEHCAPIERQHLVFPTTTTIIEDHNNFYMKMIGIEAFYCGLQKTVPCGVHEQDLREPDQIRTLADFGFAKWIRADGGARSSKMGFATEVLRKLQREEHWFVGSRAVV
ncbi:hypothetical protein B9Z65_4860 [Elsinoe australis]|uniref:Uncharacterized protein n=1 Tax=Elsinoe australis TaxID=40998 RepID=A0A2P8A690_9PEZI|nr:hypothetical protein B9Z65_4860 [Elsinoe australis]